MTISEKEIADLEIWARNLDLSAGDPDTPYWMRQQDAERAAYIREIQIPQLKEERDQQMKATHQDYLEFAHYLEADLPEPLKTALQDETLTVGQALRDPVLDRYREDSETAACLLGLMFLSVLLTIGIVLWRVL